MFRTEIEEHRSPISIDYSTQLVSLGSCFAQHIGQKLTAAKFQNEVNPVGISFNPISIFELIQRALLEDTDLSNFHTIRDEVYYNFKLHSDFKKQSLEDFEEQINSGFKQLKSKVQDANILILTLGTAWVYERVSDQEIVSNCHKKPAAEFKRRLLKVEEIISRFFEMEEHLQKVNPNSQILLTVSPVRHTKDTLEGNSISKSILRTTCHYLNEMADEVHYYPAYEIMMDDLRDYRFYESDMIHPNEQGIDYIWAHFRKTFFDSNTERTYQKWSKIQRSINHKPFNPKSEAHQKFLAKILKETRQLNGTLNLKNEIKFIQSQLA